MINLFRDLDDPSPLPDLGYEQRKGVIARGEYLRRRRRVRVIGVPLAAAAVAASAVLALVITPGTAGRDVLTPASPSPTELVLQGPGQTGEAANYECIDAAGDSVGPDVDFFSLDRPLYPLFHYALVAGEMPASGLVEFRIEATSADRGHSRQFVQRIIDGKVVAQYLRDPSTGARRDVPRDAKPYGDPADHGVGGATFPSGSLSGLGDRWTWRASISVNGRVVDSCDATQRRP